MSVEKELLVCKKKLNILFDMVCKEQERINYLDHPVTGAVTPVESAELLVMSLCKRDRGD